MNKEYWLNPCIQSPHMDFYEDDFGTVIYKKPHEGYIHVREVNPDSEPETLRLQLDICKEALVDARRQSNHFTANAIIDNCLSKLEAKK